MKNKSMIIFLVMVMALVGCSSSNESAESEELDKNTEEESTNSTGEVEDTAEKIYINDFDPGTNQIVTYGELEFQVPADWEMAEGTGNNITFDFINGRFLVASQDNPVPGSNMNSEEMQNDFLASLDDDDSYTENSHNVITIFDEIPVLCVTATRDYGNGPMNMCFYGIATDDMFYEFAGGDFQNSEYDHSKDFEQVINSLTWNKGDTAEWEDNELVKHIASYKYDGIEEHPETGEILIFWTVDFDDDCNTNAYDYEDFKCVIEACLNQDESKENQYEGCGITAYDSDGNVCFMWASYDDPDTITQFDWRTATNELPNPTRYEWKMTQEEINELLNSGK